MTVDRRGESDRVTNRQLYEAVGGLERKLEERFATRGDVKVWVLGGLLGGQAVASAITALVTRLSPPEQIAVVAGWMIGWFA